VALVRASDLRLSRREFDSPPRGMGDCLWADKPP